MKKILSYIIIFSMVAGIPSQSVWAQGFKRLEVKDKYGVEDTDPIQPKQIDQGQPQGDGTNVAPDQQLPEGMMYLNGTDLDIKEMIRQISALTGKNFIIDDKVRGKITIISDKPMTKDMAYQAFLSALEINGFTTVMTPAGLINIIQQQNSISKPIELFKDNSPNTDKYITRIIQLTNISAKEIEAVVKNMVSKNGNMLAYPTTNSLIITDAGSNIEHIMKLIRELDQEGPQEILDMIPIVYADAKEIADMINKIYEQDDEKSKSTLRSSRTARGKQTELEDVQQISKVIADERTNSVLIMGTKRSILKVRALVAKLDRSMIGAEGKIHVYYLRYAKAQEVATVLSNLVSGSSSKSSTSSSKGKSDASKTTGKSSTSSTSATNTAAAAASSSGSVTLEGGVQVTADESTNSLLVVASAKDYKTLVENVIYKLDILRPQVYLEAVIMSLDVQKNKTLGVSGLGGLINTLAGGNKLTAFGSILPITPAVLSSVATASGGFAGGLISSDTVDFTVNGADGAASEFSVPAVSSIIQALASDTDANVLSTPSIMTLDNEEAQIQVGQEVPIPAGSAVNEGMTSFNVSREDTGIILKITPQISENDSVRLTINQEITSVFSSDPNLGPTLDKKTVETVVLAQNKQTIVIGGLIDDKATVSTQKVPLLGDIPVLGNLFRNRTTSKEKTNLIVFITPYIIRERKDYMEILKKKIEERNVFIDANYGTGQKKLIRKAIANHAKELLEFKCTIPSDEDPCIASSTPYFEENVPQDQNINKTTDTSGNIKNSLQPPRKVRYR